MQPKVMQYSTCISSDIMCLCSNNTRQCWIFTAVSHRPAKL